MRSCLAGLAVVAVSVMAFAGSASAQMNSQPYKFKGGSSLGMSDAGRQAILNQKLDGRTPDNIMRGANGSLIEITKGPNNVAIARGSDGVVIPGYHGRGGAFGGGVGWFNPYFVGGSGSNNGTSNFASMITSNSIAGWTGMVVGGNVGGANSIDSWMSMIGG